MEKLYPANFILKTGRKFRKLLPKSSWILLKRFAASAIYSRNLRALATIHGSDKWGGHWYAQHYERHFGHLRRQPVLLLELGIGGYNIPTAGGASLRMWRDYFPRGRIHGVDIHDKSPHRDGRVMTHVGDQSDPLFLRSLVEKIGIPDIIIDDGSHINSHIIKSFETLFPLLAENGIYVIEDLGSSYWPDYGGSSDNITTATTGMAMLKRLTDGLNHREFLLENYQPTYTDQYIISVHFYHNIAFCQKGRNTEAGSR